MSNASKQGTAKYSQQKKGGAGGSDAMSCISRSRNQADRSQTMSPGLVIEGGHGILSTVQTTSQKTTTATNTMNHFKNALGRNQARRKTNSSQVPYIGHGGQRGRLFGGKSLASTITHELNDEV